MLLGALIWGAALLPAQNCTPTYTYSEMDMLTSCTLTGWSPSNCPLDKDRFYNLKWPDNAYDNLELRGRGARNYYFTGCGGGVPLGKTDKLCPAGHDSPYYYSGCFRASVNHSTVSVARGVCVLVSFNMAATCVGDGTSADIQIPRLHVLPDQNHVPAAVLLSQGLLQVRLDRLRHCVP
jgi:hypothetical protein